MAATKATLPREFGGKYTLLEKIGSGGMAEIFRSRLRGVDGFEKILVVKKILPRHARNRQFITMFVQEAKVVSLLQHVNIVTIYELGEVDGEYYIAMEFVDGWDLLKVLTRASKKKYPLPPGIALHVVSELCKGLGYAHAAADHAGKPLDIIHLDVSPSNILIGTEGEVKLTDFGVAKASVEGQIPGTDDRLKGKLGYMSPEQVTGKKLDNRSDVFAIGIILYELFTLKRLFLGNTDIETLGNIRDANLEPRLQRHPEIPPGVANIIRRALAVNPDTRYQTTTEIEEAISEYLWDNRMRVSAQTFARYLLELFGPRGISPAMAADAAPQEPTTAAVPAPMSPDAPALTDDEPREARVDDSTGLHTMENRRLADAQGDAVFPASPPTRPGLTSSGTDNDTVVSAVFRLRSTTGDVAGPVSESNPRDLIAGKAGAPDEQITVDDADWQTIDTVATFADPVPPPAGRRAPQDSGDFEAATCVRLFGLMAGAKYTGRLRIVGRGRLKEIWWRKGKPIHITSNDKSELLGALLLRENAITEDQLSRAIHEMRASSGPLGAVLVRLGFLDQAELFRLLDKQFRDKFVDAFRWERGRFEYYRGEEPGPDVVPFFLDPFPAITDAVRSYVPSATWLKHVTRHPDATIRLTGNARFDISKLKLSPREQRIWNQIKGRPIGVSAALIAIGSTERDRNTAAFVLFLLEQTEHIRIS